MNRQKQRVVRWACLIVLGLGLAVDVGLYGASALENRTLRLRRDQTLENIEKTRGEIAQLDQEIARLKEDVSQAELLSGQSVLEGEGVLITLSDALLRDGEPQGGFQAYLVHDVDVLNVINALRAGGAEAIAVNGARITAQSAVRCGGPTINVQRKRLTPPFLIRAIGSTEKLRAELEADGLVDYLRALGLRIQISDQASQRIEAGKD